MLYSAKLAVQGTRMASRLPRLNQAFLARVRGYADQTGKSTLRRSKEAAHTGKAATGETGK